MSWLRDSATNLTITRVSLFCLLLLVPVETEADSGATLLLEPGYLADDGTWLVPVGLMDEIGNPLEVPGTDLQATVAGEPLEEIDLGVFAPEPGGFASAIAVLGSGDFPATGVDPLAGFLAAATPAARRGFFLMGDQLQEMQPLGEKAPTKAELHESLASEDAVRLWDNILEAITALGQEGAVRKALLVVSDGSEDLPSEHPLATCVEAALRTRVAVYVIELDGQPQALVRLKELARRTGGTAIKYSGKSSLRRCLGRLDGMRALAIQPPGLALPVDLTVSFGFSAEASGTVQVAKQKALAGPSLWLLIGLTLGIVAAAVGGVIMYRSQTRIAGYLLVEDQQPPRPVSIRHSGVTVGSDNDNQLVLADKNVSRHHAVIRVQGEEIILTDLRSAGGTFVNGQQVRNASLHDGDKIFLGRAIEMTFRRHLNKVDK